MANGETWFEDMAKALKRQDHAARMVARWQKELAEAQQLVIELAAQPHSSNGVHVPEHSADQEQETVSAV